MQMFIETLDTRSCISTITNDAIDKMSAASRVPDVSHADFQSDAQRLRKLRIAHFKTVDGLDCFKPCHYQ